MIKHALAAALAGVVSLSPFFSYGAEPRRDTQVIKEDDLRLTGAIDVGPALSLYRPDVFNTVDGSVLIHSLPVLTLLEGRRFPISTDLGRMGMAPLDVFPLAFFSAVETRTIGSSPRYGSDGPGGMVDLRLKRFTGSGEVGFFYGRSDGKYGREDFQAYIIGGVGNDKVQITAGAAYTESSGRVPRPEQNQRYGRSPASRDRCSLTGTICERRRWPRGLGPAFAMQKVHVSPSRYPLACDSAFPRGICFRRGDRERHLCKHHARQRDAVSFGRLYLRKLRANPERLQHGHPQLWRRLARRQRLRPSEQRQPKPVLRLVHDQRRWDEPGRRA